MPLRRCKRCVATGVPRHRCVMAVSSPAGIGHNASTVFRQSPQNDHNDPPPPNSHRGARVCSDDGSGGQPGASSGVRRDRHSVLWARVLIRRRCITRRPPSTTRRRPRRWSMRRHRLMRPRRRQAPVRRAMPDPMSARWTVLSPPAETVTAWATAASECGVARTHGRGPTGPTIALTPPAPRTGLNQTN